MHKYIVAVALIGAFVAPALALEAGPYFVGLDTATKKCSVMHSQPASPMKSMGGPYATEAEAHKAMAGMKECTS